VNEGVSDLRSRVDELVSAKYRELLDTILASESPSDGRQGMIADGSVLFHDIAPWTGPPRLLEHDQTNLVDEDYRPIEGRRTPGYEWSYDWFPGVGTRITLTVNANGDPEFGTGREVRPADADGWRTALDLAEAAGRARGWVVPPPHQGLQPARAL
jgi:hypothetical protein